MELSDMEKLDRLNEIAEADEIYSVWKNSEEALADAFRTYVSQQPDEVYRLLTGYVGAIAMMLQRKILIAGMYLSFPDENEID